MKNTLENILLFCLLGSTLCDFSPTSDLPPNEVQVGIIQLCDDGYCEALVSSSPGSGYQFTITFSVGFSEVPTLGVWVQSIRQETEVEPNFSIQCSTPTTLSGICSLITGLDHLGFLVVQWMASVSQKVKMYQVGPSAGTTTINYGQSYATAPIVFAFNSARSDFYAGITLNSITVSSVEVSLSYPSRYQIVVIDQSVTDSRFRFQVEGNIYSAGVLVEDGLLYTCTINGGSMKSPAPSKKGVLYGPISMQKTMGYFYYCKLTLESDTDFNFKLYSTHQTEANLIIQYSSLTLLSCPLNSYIVINDQCQCAFDYLQNGSTCYKCDVSCETCFGPNQNNCSDCNTINHRTLSVNECLCNEKYFDNGNAQCQECHFSCLTCSDQNQSNCLTCASNDRRTYNNGSCLCMSPYFDNNQPYCGDSQIQCHYSCDTCNGAFSTNCLSCKVDDFRTLNVNQCLCDANRYDTGQPLCSLNACHFACLTCTGGNYNQCLQCTTLRQLDLSNATCPCLNRYYEVDQSCLKCHTSCLTCSNSTNEGCTACDSFHQLIGNTCSCKERKYGMNGSTMCFSCQYSCLTCSESTICDSCDEINDKRVKVTGLCVCQQGYYDNGIAHQCYACHTTCSICEYKATCQSCQANYVGTLNDSNCMCKNGYSNLGEMLCQIICHFSCETCSGPNEDNCISCNALANRIEYQYSAGKKCVCQTGFNDSGITQCQASCHYSCLTCNGSTSQNCQSCKEDDFRELSVNQCLCSGGYYDDQINPECQSCHFSCSSCNGPSQTNCQGCDPDSNRLFIDQDKSCVCKEKFYDANDTQCLTCHYSCSTCNGSLETNCESCNDISTKRQLDDRNQCLCPSLRYYDWENTFICQECHYSCLTCNGSNLSNCLTCAPNDRRTYNNGSCLCNRPYIDNNQPYCVGQCHYSCDTCDGTQSANCLTCRRDDFRTLNAHQCLCNDGLYDNGQQAHCQPCHYTCFTCSGADIAQCTTCNNGLNRVENSVPGGGKKCVCSDQYFESNQTCEKCDVACLTCSGIKVTDCITYTQQFSQQCQAGQYFSLQNQVCRQCLYSCQLCSDAISCLQCPSLQERNLKDGHCSCNSGFYDDNSNMKCQACHYSCYECKGPSSQQCTSCLSQQSSNRLLSGNLCQCVANYYDIGEKICHNTCPSLTFSFEQSCVPCHPICSSCIGVSHNDCLTCTDQKLVYPKIQTASSKSLTVGNTLTVTGSVQILECKDNVVSSLKSLEALSLEWKLLQGQTILLSSKTASLMGPLNFVIPAYVPLPGELHYVSLIATQEKIETTDSIYLYFVKQEFKLTLESSAVQGNKRPVIVNGFINDLDKSLIPISDLADYTFQWTCQNLVTQNPCVDEENNLIQFKQNSLNQTIPGNAFNPYQTYEFTLTAISKGVTKSQSISVAIIEEDIPQLTFIYNPTLLARKINLDENLELAFQLDVNLNPDLMIYSLQMFYNSASVAQTSFKYSKFRFKLHDHFASFKEEQGTLIQLVGQVLVPTYKTPSKVSLTLNVNIPPTKCYIVSEPQKGNELSEVFLLKVKGCYDTEEPLSYKLSYYTSLGLLAADNSVGLEFNSIPLFNFQSLPSFETILPYSEQSEQGKLIIFVQVKDSLGGLSNFTSLVEIQKVENHDILAYQSNYQLLKKQEEQIQRTLIYVERFKFVVDNKEITKFKQFLSGELSSIASQCDSFCQNQIQVVQSNLLASQDIQDTLSIGNIQEKVNQINGKLDDLLSNQQSAWNLYENEGSNSQQLQQSNQNLIQSTVIFNQVENLLKKSSKDFLSQINSNQAISDKDLKQIDEINQKGIENIQKLTQIGLIGAIPNSPKALYQTETVKSVSKVSTESGLNEFTNQNLLATSSKPEFEDENEDQEQAEGQPKTSTFYRINYFSYNDNPKLSNADYPYRNQNNQLVMLSIQEQSQERYIPNKDGKEEMISIVNPVNLKVNIKSKARILTEASTKESNQVCISQNKDKKWSGENCETKSTAKDQVQCTCNKLSYTSVVDDVQGIFTSSKNVFNKNSTEAIEDFDWFSCILFYMACGIALLYLFLAIWGYVKDKSDLVAQTTKIHVEEQMHIELADRQILVKNDDVDLEKSDNLNMDSPEFQRRPKNTDRRTTILQVKQSSNEISLQKIEQDKQEPMISNEQDISKITPSKETQETKKVEQMSIRFGQYIIENHPLSNIVMIYDKECSRPVRTMINFTGVLLALAITVYYSKDLALIRTVVIMALTAVATSFAILAFNKTLNSQSFLTFIGLNGFNVYIILATTASSTTVEQTNIWAIQYSISFAYDQIVYKIMENIFKYFILKGFLSSAGSLIWRFLGALCLTKQNMRLLKPQSKSNGVYGAQENSDK